MTNFADFVVKSNAIFTAADAAIIKGGVAVSGNKITAVADETAINDLIGPDTKVYAFGDELIMPGFIDAHMHFFVGTFVSSEYMLTDLFAAESEQHAVDMVKAFAENHPDYVRITGMGWFSACWKNKDNDALPSRALLDEAVPDRPVYLLGADAHTFWLNTRALEECGITKDTEVTFGEIGKDRAGELTGLLFEIEAAATANKNAFIMPDEIMKKLQTDFFRVLAENGVTSTTDMSASPVQEASFKEYEIAQELEREGLLTARLHLFPSLGINADVSMAKALRKTYASGKLLIAGLKQFVDGVTSTYTAYLLEPYSDKPETKGFSNYPFEVYKESVILANREGFSVRLHAIGDAGVRMALDAFEASKKANPNHFQNTIEHIECIHPDDIERFADNDVVASMQPMHIILDDDDLLVRIGEKRAQYEYAIKSLLDSGATVAFGTDYPIADINPFANIHAAVTRAEIGGKVIGVNPAEQISLMEALRAYTIGGATAVDRKEELGSLEAGKLADIVVLDRNLFTSKIEDIPETKVMLTIMDGNIVYENGSLDANGQGK
jgi:predicted amidohydrolase YtcJ